MYFVNSYLTVAIYLSVIASVTYVILHWRNSVATNDRLTRMMLSCGIDAEMIANPDQLVNLDMNEVRSRCRHCPVTTLCNRWLDGEAVASNSFCPNSWAFLNAAGSGQH